MKILGALWTDPVLDLTSDITKGGSATVTHPSQTVPISLRFYENELKKNWTLKLGLSLNRVQSNENSK